MSKVKPTEYELTTHNGRQIDESKSPGYFGSCSIDVHCLQLKDPKSWVHSSIKRWEKLGGWKSPEEKENYNQKLDKEIKDHFSKAEALYTLVQKDVARTAFNICKQKGNSLDYMDSTKLGCYMAYCERLITLLSDEEIDRLTGYLEKRYEQP